MKTASFRLSPQLFRGLACLIFSAVSALQASDLYVPVPEAVFQGTKHGPWEAVERHRDPHPRFPDEPHPDKLTVFFPPIAEAFGTISPHPSQFLLHRAPGWDIAQDAVPVLLIPGANDDATRRYAHPLPTKHRKWAETPGLMQHLVAAGRSVFSLSFSHYHGDNLLQGEQVANAVSRIRCLLDRESDPTFQVDLVTFSKGAMPARSYLQDGGDLVGGPDFLTRYRGDVRRVAFLCAPLGGVDTPFRYYLYNLMGVANKIPAPLGATRVTVYGQSKAAGPGHIMSGFWTGQLQMLADLRDLGVGPGPLSWTADANLSQRALVDGGSSFLLSSPGIEAAVLAGGNMIAKLNARGLPPEVSAGVLAGTDPILMDERFPHVKIPAGTQLAGPNDGLVFLKSALYTKGLTARGARILGTKTLDKNHIDLSRSEAAFAWVSELLSSAASRASQLP